VAAATERTNCDFIRTVVSLPTSCVQLIVLIVTLLQRAVTYSIDSPRAAFRQNSLTLFVLGCLRGCRMSVPLQLIAWKSHRQLCVVTDVKILLAHRSVRTRGHTPATPRDRPAPRPVRSSQQCVIKSLSLNSDTHQRHDAVNRRRFRLHWAADGSVTAQLMAEPIHSLLKRCDVIDVRHFRIP